MLEFRRNGWPSSLRRLDNLGVVQIEMDEELVIVADSRDRRLAGVADSVETRHFECLLIFSILRLAGDKHIPSASPVFIKAEC